MREQLGWERSHRSLGCGMLPHVPRNTPVCSFLGNILGVLDGK